jgi:class 3 adenylate cyclase
MSTEPPIGAHELEVAGLYDPRAPDAADRLAVLEYLVGLGATVDDLAAARPGELPILASTLKLWGRRERYTLDEVARATGVDPDLLERASRAAGFAQPDALDAARFTPRDIEVFGMLGVAVDFIGAEVTLQLLRVLGAAAARVADASVSAFVVNVVPRMLESDPSGLALTKANAESMAMLDGMSGAFDTLLRHHIELAFRPAEEVIVPGIDVVRRSVGFADLVDSTGFAQQLDFGALSHALGEFDARASELVVANGGRVVKLIGDEIMFVANEPIAAAQIAFALVDEFANHDVLPPVRTGIASRDVLIRDGDCSGPVVNLAARAVKLAAPSTLVVDRATAAVVEPVYGTGEAILHTLKGFADPVELVRVVSRPQVP